MLIQKFEEQVEKTPGSIALKSRDKIFTYMELNGYSSSIAHVISTAASGEIVGLLFEHGVHMVAAILGALKAGKTYVPLSVDYPFQRLAYMLSDSEASLIVTGTASEPLAQKLGKDRNIPVVDIETCCSDPVFPATNPSRSISGEKTAYIMYTSGSTGRPKGVIQNHKNVLYYTRNWVRVFSITASDKMTLLTSLCHDGSVQDIFSALLSGAALFPFDVKKQKKTGELMEFLLQEKITIWHSVPTLFRYFINTLKGTGNFEYLRFIQLGGERVRAHDVDVVKKQFPNSRLAIIYGQTESSVNSIFFIPEEERYRKTLLGTPLDETTLFVVDEEGNTVKPLRSGEILVACRYISPGYWKRPETTEEVFQQDEDLGRLYWTGDMGRRLPDGSIEFLGRRDSQVKIRGFRIEPGEIETQLMRHEYIKEAVVVPNTGDDGETFLSAYYCSRSENKNFEWSNTKLREYLARVLPDYMIPSYFVQLERIPLTSSGKVDRQALPLPQFKTDREYAAPTGPIEENLAHIWAQVLQVEKSTLSINDNFFELGGHSLSAMLIMSKIHKAFNISVPLMQIFKTPNIRGLARYIKTGFKDQKEYFPIPAVEKKQYHMLSPAQKRLYILQMMDPGGTSYNMPEIHILEEELQRRKLEDTFNALIEKHESLRTSFIFVNEEPVQRINEEVEVKVEEKEAPFGQVLNACGPGDTEGTRGPGPLPEEPAAALISSFIRPFDLSKAPLLRVGITKFENGKHLLMVDMHHIISDALSHWLLIKDFMAAYNGSSLPELRIQYKDYAVWYEKIQGNENEEAAPTINTIKTQRDYWIKEFAGETPVLNLPTDFLRPAVQDFSGQSSRFEVEVDKAGDMKKLALEKGVTPFMVIMAVYTIMLGKLSSQEDIIIGTTTAGRNHNDLEHIAGMFVNTLAIRNTIQPGKTFLQWLTEVKEKVLKAFENQDYPFEDLVEQVVVDRNVSRNPLFDVMFSFIDIEADGEKLAAAMNANLKIQPYPHQNRTAKFDLTLYGRGTTTGLVFTFEYRTKLFKTNTIQRFIRYFKKVLSTIIENPNIKPGEIELISSDEKRQLVYDFNDTAVDYPRDKTIDKLFEEQVERRPDNIAVIGKAQGAERKAQKAVRHTPCAMHCAISYRELNNQSLRLAHLLIGKGVKTGIIVGIMMDRSIGMITGILGILKAGGAYLPIDPAYPEDRINYMLADSSAKTLVISPVLPGKNEKLLIDNCQLLMFNENPSGRRRLNTPPKEANSINNLQLKGDNLAYVIYTSGSTGRPKGVMIEHRAVHNFFGGMAGIIDFKPGKIILALTTITFDIFGLETLLPLCRGLKVVLADEDHQREMGLLEQLVIKNCVDMMQATPGRMQMFTVSRSGRSCLGNLRELMVGGEALPVKLLAELKQSTPAKIYNMYGPTETTIWSTVKDLTRAEEINIGTPVQNTVIYIFDKHYHLQPVGVPGEICIGGDGLARGYINRPQLTADRFYRSYKSYKTYISKKLYKTGDLARWLPDGNIQFLGRLDHQVKIRGFRIELGEIENQLIAHGKIKEAIVLAREDNNDKYLCAYVVAKPGETNPIDQSGLRAYLLNRLPDYMVPSYFIQLDSIPLTPNGKIDRKALPDQVFSAGQDYTAPGNKIEKELVDIWAEILGRDQLHVVQLRQSIGIDNNFFQMGGHSLKATILLARIHKKFDIQIPLVQFFKAPTIKKLAGYIYCTGPDKFVSIQPVEKKEYYALSSAQKRLYILHQFEKDSKAYNMPLILTLEGNIIPGTMEDIFKKLISRHESLRTRFEKINEEPVQLIQGEIEFEMEYLNISQEEPGFDVKEESSPESANTQLDTIIIDLFIRPFDLAKAPLIRVGLRKIQKDKHILMLDIHHIITDGVSHNILVSDFSSLYAGQKLPPLIIQYKEYSEWQQSRQVQNAIKAQEEYWLKEFAENIPVLNLPTDFSRPPVKSFVGNNIGFALSVEEIRTLYEMAHTEKTTLFMVILAVYNILLAKLSGREDIVVGTPIAGRRHMDLQAIVGVFINTLALRSYPSGEKTFKLFLKEIKEKTIKSLENQDYQLEDLVEKVAAKRDSSRNPLFDVSFAQQNFFDVTGPGGKTGKEIRDLKITPYAYENRVSKFDLYLRVYEVEEKLHFSFEYSTKLFTKETILRFIQYFKKIISSGIVSPGKKISQMEIMTGQEKNRLLYDFNAGETGYPKDKRFHELFEEQVKQTPNRVILVAQSAGSKAQSLEQDKECPAPCPMRCAITYRELNNRANHITRLLREKQVKPGTIAGIMVTPSVDLVAGMIGILKAGAAFLPIEPGTPVERINFFLADSNINILLTGAQVTETINAKTEIINIEDANLYGAECGNPGKDKGTNPMYLTYISAAGGKPSGVLITHKNLLNYIHWFVRILRLTAADKAVLTSSADFDALYAQLFSSLLTGCQLHIIPREIFLFAEGLLSYLKENKITYIKITPHLFNFIVNHPMFSPGTLQKLRVVILVGEEIKVKDVEKTHLLCSHIQIMSHYGLTETTIGSIARFIDIDEFQQYKTAPSLGKPIDNTRVYILDKGFGMVPVGVTGELFIGGDGVGIGYLNNPELTAEKFHTVSNRAHKSYMTYITFKTGDLARWKVDGNIEFLGRIDQQVNIRGYRVALGEIRDLLDSHPDIKETAVVAREREDGEKVLYAYFVGVDNQASEKTLTPGQLRHFLSRNLPDYMIPSHFVKIEKIPLTRKGKIDGKALEKLGKTVDPDVEYSPPTTGMEKKIANIWTEMFKLDKVSIHDDFFELGGNSLTVITLTSRLREIGCTISLAEVMSNPTIKELTSIIDEGITSPDSKEKIDEERQLSRLACIEKLNNGRGGKNIFLFHPRHGMVNQYKEMAKLVEKKFNVYGVHARAWNSAWKVPENTWQVIDDYLEQLLALQKTGPYIIGGFCVGTAFGYEICRKLEQMGHQVEKLILFDSHCFFSDPYARFLRALEYLPGVVKKLYLFSLNRRFKKEIRTEKLFKTDGKKRGEITIEVEDDLRREKISRYMNILYSYVTPLEFIKAPILVLLVENTDRWRATEENFNKMTKDKAKVVETTGDHNSMWEKPYVEKLAEVILNNL